MNDSSFGSFLKNELVVAPFRVRAIFRRSIAGALLFLLPLQTFAATRTWDAGGADNNWSTAANWSDDTAPTAADTALFDGTGQTDAIIDAAASSSGAIIQTTSSFTGSILFRRSFTLNEHLLLSGGTLDMSGTGHTLTVKGSWVNDGATFTAGTGTVILAGSGTTYSLKETNAFKHLLLDDGLLGYYRLDETSGTTAVDNSRYGTPTTLYNGPTPSYDLPSLSFENVRSLYFDGVDDYVQIVGGATGTIYNVQSSDFTAALWLKMPLTPSGTFLLGHAGLGQAQGFRALHIGGGILRFRIANSSSTTILDTAAVNDNTWHHFAFQKHGNTLSIYKDGVLHASTTTSITNIDTSGPFHLGGRSSDMFLKITLDDFRLYNRALSASEIQFLASGQQGTGFGRYVLDEDLDVHGNLTIYSGMLDVSSSNYSITASGSFINNASFVPRSGTLTLNGLGTTLKMYGTELYNLTIASARSTILRAAATITSALTLNTSSIFTLNSHTLTATNASITNSGLIAEGTGSILHTSTLFTSPPAFGLGDSLHVTVTDSDANLNGTAQDTLSATVGGQTLTLTETTNTSGIFTGSISTAEGALSNLTLCTYVDISYVDPQDPTDTKTARSLVIDPSSSCNNIDGGTSGGSGGGSRGGITRTTTAISSTPSTSSAPASPSDEEEPSPRFSDVPASSWFYSFVEHISSLGIVSGYEDKDGNLTGYFGPSDPVTVGQTIKIALLAAEHELPIPAGIPANRSATDWSAPYIALAESLNLTLASERVTQNATRGEVIEVLLEAFEIPLGSSAHPFTDLPANHPHANAIATAHALGIVTGDTDAAGNPLNAVRPDDTINRAEVAALVVRMLKSFP